MYPTRQPIHRTTIPTQIIQRTPKVTNFRQSDTSSKARERKSNSSSPSAVDLLTLTLMVLYSLWNVR